MATSSRDNAGVLRGIEAIVARTTESPITRAAFLGQAATVMLAALGVAASAASDQPPKDDTKGGQDEETTGKGRFVIYQQTDYKGEESYGVAELTDFTAMVGDAQKTSKAMHQAYLEAKKAWKDDKAHADEPFPMKLPKPIRLNRVGSFSDRQRAEDLMQRRQDKLDERADRYKKREERRLSHLNDKQREHEKGQADLLKTAEQLFESKLNDLTTEKPKDEKGKDDQAKDGKAEDAKP